MAQTKSKSNLIDSPNSNPFDRLLNRRRILINLDGFQDILVIILMLGLLVHMSLLLIKIFLDLRTSPGFNEIADEMLQVLILVEIFRLMAVYLESHHIPITEAVEVTLVSVLREVIVIGILHMTWQQIASICGFVLMMGTLLLVETYSAKQGHGHGHNNHHDH
jgi:uncharacterized membrane protein (DUF373 family)